MEVQFQEGNLKLWPISTRTANRCDRAAHTGHAGRSDCNATTSATDYANTTTSAVVARVVGFREVLHPIFVVCHLGPHVAIINATNFP